MNHSKSGQIVKRSENTYTVRVFLGHDGQGKKKYRNKTVHGNLKDAQKVLNTMLRDKDMGLLAEPTRTTLDEHLDKWLEVAAKPRVKESTFKDYERLLRLYIRKPLGGRKLSQLTPVEIQGVYADMSARGLSPRTIRYAHSVLRDALEQAVKWRILGQNPANYVDLPRKEHREAKALTADEVGSFLEVASTSKHHVLFALLAATGLRPSEALALKWTDVDFREGLLSVRRTLSRVGSDWRFDRPKTARGQRSVALPDGLLSLLLEHQRKQREDGIVNEHNLLFTSETGAPLDERNILHRHFRPLLKAAGLPESIRLYDLRHTCATLLLQAGVHPKIVSERLGHASITLTLDTYSHVLPGMQQESAEKLNALLFEKQDAEKRAYN